jgi:hypothetical protein
MKFTLSRPWWLRPGVTRRQWFARLWSSCWRFHNLRWVHRVWSLLICKFWLPCPTCGRMVGAHELTHNSLVYGVPSGTPGTARCVCPSCGDISVRFIGRFTSHEIESCPSINTDEAWIINIDKPLLCSRVYNFDTVDGEKIFKGSDTGTITKDQDGRILKIGDRFRTLTICREEDASNVGHEEEK